MQDNSLASKDFWEQIQGEVNFERNNNDALFDWLDKFIKEEKKGTFFEIGCYPGRFLHLFGKAGYTVSGIDFLDITDVLESKLRGEQIKVDEIMRGDFFSKKIDSQYFLVTSFGFIEHFVNYEDVIKAQAELVEPDGKILIEAPNFAGFFQRIPRWIFDNTNFHKHNLKAMRPGKWKDILLVKGFEDIEIEYIGNYKLWYEKKKFNLIQRFLKNMTEVICFQFIKVFFKKKKPLYSPYIILTAKKK